MAGFAKNILLPVAQIGAGIAGTAFGGPAGIALAALPAAFQVGKGIANKNPFQAITGAATGALGGLGAAGALGGSLASTGANAGASIGSVGGSLANSGASIGSALGNIGQVASQSSLIPKLLGGGKALAETGLGIYQSLQDHSPVSGIQNPGINPNLSPVSGTNSGNLPGIPQVGVSELGQIPEYKYSLPQDKTAQMLQLLGAFRG